MKFIQPYISSKDARGTFTGLINSGQWEEMNIIETEAGQTRGGHYHKHTRELFFILEGAVEVEVSCPGQSKQVYSVKKGDIFLIEPLEVHIFRSLTKCAWINILSKKMDPAAPDFFK